MIKELIIQGENNHRLVISNILPDDCFFSAEVYLQSDWYEAKVAFNSSIDRLNEFSYHLNLILTNNQKKTNFINDDGNFDLNVSVNEDTGKVQINGILIKNMMDESRIEYYMESDYHNLDIFKHSIDRILEYFRNF